MDFDHVVALITAPSQEVGRQIADILLEKRLAACVNTAVTWIGSMK